ncbi:MAG TPA: UDP-N-acetylmuramoyl-tripeptide--D-alanyl-D-alanine ligase [Candidatus Saccharimonadales bacterium]|nr:UDP-N-acetylmuramoyl-tripeptide--D-alanyl-D-alanine ligase [Candidatus Saccharimonadales bacterium]
MFTLERLLAASGGRVVRGSPDPVLRFSGGAYDSRLIEGGECFFALRDQRDGHDFVRDALARGAAAAVVEHDVLDLAEGAVLVQVPNAQKALRAVADAVRDDRPIPAVAITGSVGKTTTKEATAATLGARYRVLRTIASYNNEIGVPLTFLRQEPTHEVAVIELGFYVPGEIADLSRLVRQRVGIVTTIPEIPVHFARTPSVEAIVSGKAELVEALPEDGVALLNADDPRVRGMAARTRARVLLYGESAEADIRATDVRDAGLDGIRFVAHVSGEHAEAHLPLPGRHLLTSGLAAIGAAVVLGVPLDEAAVGLATLERPAHRMSVRRAPGLVVIDDSYNASPAAVHAALAVLRGVRGRRVAVLGDMLELGSLSVGAHEAVGADVATSADALVAVGELAGTIAAAAERNGLRDVQRATDGGEALVRLRQLLRPGDTVLVKGSRALALDKLADALVGTEAPA